MFFVLVMFWVVLFTMNEILEALRVNYIVFLGRPAATTAAAAAALHRTAGQGYSAAAHDPRRTPGKRNVSGE